MHVIRQSVYLALEMVHRKPTKTFYQSPANSTKYIGKNIIRRKCRDVDFYLHNSCLPLGPNLGGARQKDTYNLSLVLFMAAAVYVSVDEGEEGTRPELSLGVSFYLPSL